MEALSKLPAVEIEVMAVRNDPSVGNAGFCEGKRRQGGWYLDRILEGAASSVGTFLGYDLGALREYCPDCTGILPVPVSRFNQYVLPEHRCGAGYASP